MVVRELTGGIYFGAKTRTATAASDLCEYTAAEIERITRVAGRLAMARRQHMVYVDKANVLETSRLWRSVVERVMRSDFPQVRLDHMLVDAAAMHLIRRPRDFDVLVTENMFGDILTDEASMLAGSMGLLPSASLGDGPRGLYEPIHGSAPDIAGRGIANPYGTILSCALLLRHSLDLPREAAAVESAVARAIDTGACTPISRRHGCPVDAGSDRSSARRSGSVNGLSYRWRVTFTFAACNARALSAEIHGRERLCMVRRHYSSRRRWTTRRNRTPGRSKTPARIVRVMPLSMA
jgi:3-isopropylmalate dehydrogenase